MNKKYPLSLFLIGFVMNIFGRFFFLFLPALIFLIGGIWNKVSFYIGAILLIFDVVLSFIEQLKIRSTTLNSDDPNFKEFQEAILSPDWKNNIKEIVEDKIEDENDTSEE